MVSLRATDIVVIYSCVLIILYRLTRRIVPTHRNSPPRVQTYIPWLGAAPSFLFRRTSFLTSCRSRYGSVYKFLVGGKHMVVVSSPMTISQVLESSPKVLRSLEEKGLESMGGLSERVPHLVTLLHKTAYSFLSSGLTKRSMESVTSLMNKNLFSCLRDFIDAQGMERRVSLEDFVCRSIYSSSCTAFFGASFPDTFADFTIMDAGMFHVSTELPFLATEAYKARSGMADAIERYVQQAWAANSDGYVEGASSIISGTLREFQKDGISTSEAARLLTFLLWGFNSNFTQTTNNALAYLLANPQTYYRVVADIRKTVDEKFPDFEMLLAAEPEVLECPEFAILDSIIQETLRISSLASSFREAQCDASIQDENGTSYLIQKGDIVLADVRSMHHDPKLFPNPESFIADRFLNHKESYKMRGVRSDSIVSRTRIRAICGEDVPDTSHVPLRYRSRRVRADFRTQPHSDHCPSTRFTFNPYAKEVRIDITNPRSNLSSRIMVFLNHQLPSTGYSATGVLVVSACHRPLLDIGNRVNRVHHTNEKMTIQLGRGQVAPRPKPRTTWLSRESSSLCRSWQANEEKSF